MKQSNRSILSPFYIPVYISEVSSFTFRNKVKMHLSWQTMSCSLRVQKYTFFFIWQKNLFQPAGQTHEKFKNQYDINICDGVVNRWSRLRI